MTSRNVAARRWLGPLLATVVLLGAPMAPPSSAVSTPTQRAQLEGNLCAPAFNEPKVVRVWDKHRDIVIHRRSTVTLPPGTYSESTFRRARLLVGLRSGISLDYSGGAEVSGLAGKVLGKAESKYNLHLTAAGRYTKDTETRVKISHSYTLRNSATFVLFRGIERYRGRHVSRICVPTTPGSPLSGRWERHRGRWVSWDDTGAGGLRCGDSTRRLNSIAKVAMAKGCD